MSKYSTQLLEGQSVEDMLDSKNLNEAILNPVEVRRFDSLSRDVDDIVLSTANKADVRNINTALRNIESDLSKMKQLIERLADKSFSKSKISALSAEEKVELDDSTSSVVAMLFMLRDALEASEDLAAGVRDVL